jgi:hypothetical protein
MLHPIFDTPTAMYSAVLYCTTIVLYCTERYCIVLYCTVLYCTVLQLYVLLTFRGDYCEVLSHGFEHCFHEILFAHSY